jgi:hypothetical protein
MKRYKIIITIMIIALIIVVFFKSDLYAKYYNNKIDKKMWTEMSNGLKEENISKVVIPSGRSTELVDSEKNAFIQSLKASQFQKSNWIGEGSTGVSIMIIMNDGTRQYVEYFGGSTFELTYKNRQFIILNYELAKLIDSYGVRVI